MKYLIILLILVGCVTSPEEESKYPLKIEGDFGKEDPVYKAYLIEHEEFQYIWETEDYDKIMTVYYKSDNSWLPVKSFYLKKKYIFDDNAPNKVREVGFNLAVVCKDGYSSCRDSKYLVEVR